MPTITATEPSLLGRPLLWRGTLEPIRRNSTAQMDPRARRRLRTQALLRRRFSPQVFWSSLAVSLALGIITSVVYGAV